MVVHLCCSVDAGYFLKRLKEEFNEKIIGYFFDPNIHPYSEFKLRSLDTKRICEKLGIEFVEGEYKYIEWLKATKGYENEEEKGKRCSLCFEFSLKETAKFAKKLNENKITTSLLLSPKKSHSQLKEIAEIIKKEYGIDFLILDYRKKGGTQAQQQFAKENQLYRQDYCGCLYGLYKQKEIIDELFSPFPFQILPNSIEEKIKIYENLNGKIIKETFLNYRLLNSTLKVNKKPVIHYTIFYSYLQKPQRVKIEFINNEIGYSNRGNIIFIKLNKLNQLLNKNFKDIKDLFNSPLTIDEELKIREKITNSTYSLSPIIVVDEFYEKMDILINAKIYPDVREILIQF